MLDRNKKPILCLVGCDGNAFGLIAEAMDTLKSNGATQDQIKEFELDAISGNYDHLIQTLQKWFRVRLESEDTDE